jgi:peptide/nickel transport system substrate-binding protein
MKRHLPLFMIVVMLTSTILSACATPTPQVVEKVVTQVVEKEKVVQATVVVEKEKVVEKPVEKPVVVTATPVPPTAVPQVPKEKQMGGTLNVWLPNGWPDKAWPYLTNWESTFAVSPMAEYLFWPKPDGTVEPLLGQSATVSADGLVWTVKLRPNVKWHDGTPFTAEDVRYTHWMHAHPKLVPLGWLYNGLTIKDYTAFNAGKAADITGIKVIDDLTIQYTLDSPDASFARTFLVGNQIPILPKHKVSALPEATRFNNKDPYWYTNPVGTGPYKFVKYVEDQYIEYARNDNWWGGKVGPEKLFMKISSPEVALIALEKGELDYMYPTNLSEIKRLQANPNIELIEAKNGAQFFGLIPNYMTMKGAWRDPKVKQAFLKSIDRQGYVNTIMQGFGAVRDSPFDGSAYACPTIKRWTYDPVEAEKLWTAAGWPKEKRGEWTMDFMSWLGNKPRLDYLPIMQEAMRKLGFKANVDLIDNSLITDYYSGKGPRGKDYDTTVLLWGPGADPQGMSFLSDPTSKTNSGMWGCPDSWDPNIKLEDAQKTCWKYENARVSELFALTAKETDPAKRIKYFQEIDCILNEEIPFFVTAAPSFVLSKSKRLQGVQWETGASLGLWMALYRPGDLWLWQK